MYNNQRTRVWAVLAVSASLWFTWGATPVEAKNPFTTYFSRLLDESRAELAAGRFLVDTLASKSKDLSPLGSSPDLDAAVASLTPKSSRNTLPYRVLVLENPIPGEIPFPGGTIVLTRGTLGLFQNDQERDFVLARNIMHISLRHPMKIIKREGLYARILRLLKNRRAPNLEEQAQKILQEYISAVTGMDQVRADREAIGIMPSPEVARQAAITFLERWSKAVWPAMPWNTNDIPLRIQALTNLKP